MKRVSTSQQQPGNRKRLDVGSQHISKVVSTFPLQSLSDKMIDIFKQENNLTYKTLGSDEYQILVNWYRSHLLSAEGHHQIEKEDIVLSNSFLSIYSSIVLGCTTQSNTVLMFCPALAEYQTPLKTLRRRSYLWELEYCQKNNRFAFPSRQQLEAIFSSRQHTFRLVVIGNPLGNIFPQNQIRVLLQVCKKHQIPVVFDERLGDYYGVNKQFNTALSYKSVYEDIVVVNEVGHFVASFPADSAFHGCSKVYSIFGSAKLRGKVEKYLYQGFKILANYLHGALIKVSYQSQQGEKYWKYISDLTQKNYQLVKAFFKHKNMEHLVGPYAGVYATINLAILHQDNHASMDLWEKVGQKYNFSSFAETKEIEQQWQNNQFEVNELGFFIHANYVVGDQCGMENIFCVELRNSSNKVLSGLSKMERIIFPLLMKPKI